MSSLFVKLTMAAMWLIFTLAIFAVEWISGPLENFRPFGISAGWFTLVLALFNGLRALFILLRSRRKTEEADQEDWRRKPQPRRMEPPDPNFQFDEPARTEEERPKPSS